MIKESQQPGLPCDVKEDNPLLTKFIPSRGLALVKYNRKQFIDKLGLEIVQGVVASIMKGKNVRDLTEGLTQRRVLMLSSSIIVTYLEALSSVDDFENKLSSIVKQNLSLKLSETEKIYLRWFVGLTKKSIQNVVREDKISSYIDVFDTYLKDIAKDLEQTYGDITILGEYNDHDFTLKWPNLARCLLAVGAATLTARGSEKSLYGKVFEIMVLGSALTILGFELIDKTDVSKDDKVFWLSERKDKRESDATLLVRRGVGVRFDIGFIGKGNTEISLDKVSRFEREMERGGEKHYTSTIILVDNIGENSRIVEMAKKIDGVILQMREHFWVYKLAQTIKEKCDYESPILSGSLEDSLRYIDEKMKEVDLTPILKIADAADSAERKKSEGDTDEDDFDGDDDPEEDEDYSDGDEE